MKHFCPPAQLFALFPSRLELVHLDQGPVYQGHVREHPLLPWLQNKSQIMAWGIFIKNVMKVWMKTQSFTDRKTPGNVFFPS